MIRGKTCELEDALKGILSCFALTASALPSDAQELSNAAKWLIDNAVSEGCGSRGGDFSAEGIYLYDFDADGQEDLALMHEWVTCNGSPPESSNCGARFCRGEVFLRRDGLLKSSVSFIGTGLEVYSDSPPTFKFIDSRVQEVFARWDGAKFSNVQGAPESLDDKIEAHFEENGCVLEEGEILEFIVSETGGLSFFANNKVIETTNRDDIVSLSSNPGSYRFVGSEICSDDLSPGRAFEDNSSEAFGSDDLSTTQQTSESKTDRPEEAVDIATQAYADSQAEMLGELASGFLRQQATRVPNTPIGRTVRRSLIGASDAIGEAVIDMWRDVARDQLSSGN